jgi:peptidoglycan-associated lipoprotein
MRRLALALSLTSIALLTACGSAPVDRDATAVAAAPLAPPPAAMAAPEGAAAPAEADARAVAAPATARPAHLDPQSAIARERLIFFGFDDAKVREAYAPVVELHAKYLVANPELAIRIEGHTDARGSTEYNLALGQRRAEAVQRALKGQGVKEAQMDTRSWGEERPREEGQTRAAHAQNRRVELVYPER